MEKHFRRCVMAFSSRQERVLRATDASLADSYSAADRYRHPRPDPYLP
jgi:hypothetical protein